MGYKNIVNQNVEVGGGGGGVCTYCAPSTSAIGLSCSYDE